MDPPLKRVRFNRARAVSTRRRSNVGVRASNHDGISSWDVVFDILMRVHPCSIFYCILVSKHWLSVVASPLFRKHYLNKWGFQIVGLFTCNAVGDPDFELDFGPDVQMVPTTYLGRNMNAWYLRPPSRIGAFISKCPNSTKLLFGGIHPERWYVVANCKSGSRPVQLPPPPAYYKACMANIIADQDDENFKVILARVDENGFEEEELSIQSFCSRTRNWEQATLTSDSSFALYPRSTRSDAGIVTKQGVIYWSAVRYGCFFLVAWDMNGGLTLSSIYPPWVDIPPHPPRCYLPIVGGYYGVSQPQGNLLYASFVFYTYNSKKLDHSKFASVSSFLESELLCISVWGLADDGASWNMLHRVRVASIWANNSSMLASLSKFRDVDAFSFVSLVPGTSDSILVALQHHLFAYHFGTGKLDYLEHASGFHDFRSCEYHPLTLLDLGVWPSLRPN